MKYPVSVPGVGLVGGKFSDGDPAQGIAASLDPSSHTNAITDEIINVIVAGGLTPDEFDLTQLLKAIQSAQLTGGRLLNVQVFAASGIYTPTAGTRKVIVEAVGGGGGSGGVPATSASQNSASGNGGNGAYGKALFTSNFAGLAVTVGAGGVAGTGAPSNGGNGGTSSFGALLSCPGGLGSSMNSYSGVPVNSVGGGTSSAPVGANMISSRGTFGAWAMMVSLGVASTNGQPNTVLGAYGVGAQGKWNPAYGGVQGGTAGEPGLVIVWEFA